MKVFYREGTYQFSSLRNPQKELRINHPFLNPFLKQISKINVNMMTLTNYFVP